MQLIKSTIAHVRSASGNLPDKLPCRRIWLIGLLLPLIVSCSTIRDIEKDSAPSSIPDLNSIPDAVPRNDPLSRYGNPASYAVNGKTYYTLKSDVGYVEQGISSWYGTKFHGRRTSSGETYDMFAMTAAHKTLPLPSYVRVTNLRNGRSTVVRVNDRGPFHNNRIIDLSYAAAHKLNIIGEGTGLVEVRAVGRNSPPPPPKIVLANHQQGPLLFFLQVGAFSQLDNAIRMRNRLASAAIRNIMINQPEYDDLYRVRIGPINSVDTADQLVVVLHTLGIHDPQVIVD